MSFRILAAVYFSVLAVEIYANAAGAPLVQFFSKPLLMPILLVYYFLNARTSVLGSKYLIIFALFFSWLGDLLLLIDKHTKSWFVYGLLAFLIAHLGYLTYFWKIRRVNRIVAFPSPLIFLAVAAYSLSLFGFIAPNVQSLLVPVGVYALVISSMLAASLAAFDFGKHNFGKISVAGTLLFIVSDSILAISRFAAPFELAPVFVMTTYALAQMLITEGSLRNLKNLSAANNTNNAN